MSKASPSPSPNRRVEQGQQSRERLLQSARALFEREGYAATGTEALLAATGLTRGALYHHFRDKRDLFVAVCATVHAELGQAIEAACAGVMDPAEQLVQGALAWVRAAAQPGPRRLLLLDAPAVLGAAEWARLDESQGFARLREGVAAVLGPRADPLQAEALATALNGAINALTLWLAQDPAARAPLMDALVRRLCLSLLEAKP